MLRLRTRNPSIAEGRYKLGLNFHGYLARFAHRQSFHGALLVLLLYDPLSTESAVLVREVDGRASV
jgi:hypothetical protein